MNKYSRRTPARIPFPGSDFCDEAKGQEFLLVGRVKKKERPRPVHISFQGNSVGESAYEVLLDLRRARLEQWVVVGGAEEDVVGDVSFIQQGYPFELRFSQLGFARKEIIQDTFAGSNVIKMAGQCKRI